MSKAFEESIILMMDSSPNFVALFKLSFNFKSSDPVE